MVEAESVAACALLTLEPRPAWRTPANGLTSGAVADAAMVAEEVKADIGQPRLAALACEARRANACLRQSTLALSGDAGGTVEASTR